MTDLYGQRVRVMASPDAPNRPCAGQTGKVVALHEISGLRLVVRMDADNRERVFYASSLELENPMKNIKTAVGDAVRALLKPLDADSAKEQAVRKLGVASELVRLGEADKKRAKTELTTLGIITGGEQNGVVFDSPRYVMTATTKAASSRLDATALRAALEAERLSGAAITRILGAATVTSKAATSFTVESK